MLAVDPRSEASEEKLTWEQLVIFFAFCLHELRPRPRKNRHLRKLARQELEEILGRIEVGSLSHTDGAVARSEVALSHRPDLNEARLRLEQERLETAVTRNGLLPRMDLFITLGKTGYADTFLQSFGNIQDDSYDATAKIRSHLEEVVTGEFERLKVGSSTALQVAQARRDLLETRIQEVEALISYRIALIELYLAEGSLLQRRGITIPGDS